MRRYCVRLLHSYPDGSKAAQTIAVHATCIENAVNSANIKAYEMGGAAVVAVWLASQGDFKTRTNN